MQLNNDIEFYALTIVMILLSVTAILLLFKALCNNEYFEKHGCIKIRRKYTAIALLIILSIFFANIFFTIIASKANTEYDLTWLINATLGVPHYDPELSQVLDITHLSNEEWSKPACHKMIYDIENQHLASIQLPLMKCIDITPYWSSNEYIVLSINDYIFQHSHLFKNLINVIEKPCDYIPTDKEYMHYVKQHDIDQKQTPKILQKFRTNLKCEQRNIDREKVIIFFNNRESDKFYNRFKLVIQHIDK